MTVIGAKVHPTQVHIQITQIDDSESVRSALVRFERLSLPDDEDARNVALRFLKILTPVKCAKPLYDGNIVPPKEGELHRRSNVLYNRRSRAVDHNFNPPVWSVSRRRQRPTIPTIT